MHYLEEIDIGACFSLNKDNFILTSDFQNNGKRLCVNLKTGNTRWLKPDESVEIINIYTFDQNSNIVGINTQTFPESKHKGI